jgi:hypothetical protein
MTNKLPHLQDRIAFYHAALFSPVLSTWTNAINAGYLDSWPALTSKQVTQYAPRSEATVMGHMHAQRSNINSTKATTTPPILPPSTQRTNVVYTDCQTITGNIGSDQTGRFVVPSTSGNNYLFILYDYDSNSIHAEPIPNRKKESIKTAYTKILRLLQRRGLHPQLHRLDNEASQLLKEFITDENIEFQLTPASLHRRNWAERAIQTFKNHFISGLCTTHPDFPLNLWDKLLPQAVLTLNLLRPSRINPQLSAHSQVHGHFNFDKTPLAPPGIKVLAHEPADGRESFAVHAVRGYYVGPCLNHYRCFNVWTPSTNATRIVNTVDWFPHQLKMPTASTNDTIIAAAKDLTAALRQKNKQPLLPPTNTQTRFALAQLSDIFNNATRPLHSTDADLPRVPPKPFQLATSPSTPATLPRVLPTTTNDYLAMTQVNRQNKRRNQRQRSTASANYATNALPTTITHLINQEIHRAHKPQHNPFLRANAVLNAETGKLEEYRHLLKGVDKLKWEAGCSKEIARLAQGRKDSSVKGTETMHFIPISKLPKGKKPTYLRICANYRPQKSDPYRIRWTVGGNLVDYKGETYTPTADLTTAKLLLNSTISTPGAKFFCIDLANFYLITPFTDPSQYEYLWIPTWAIPSDIMQEYNLKPLIHKDRILVEIRTGMYGLPQSGRFAYIKLIKHLADDGYHPTGHTPGLFRHVTRPTIFNLVVDDFGVKFVGDTHAQHLIDTLQKHYDTTIDKEGKIFCGIHLDWDYPNKHVDLTMPKYVTKGLARLQHPHPQRPQHSPHPYAAPVYGQKQQYAKPVTTRQLTPAQTKYCQEFTGIFNYYARAIDNTMQTAISSIASSISTSTWDDISFRINHFLNYAATHPNAKLRYTASQMHLWLHSDASYLNESKARSRNGGFFFLSSKPTLPIKPDDPAPPLNAPILVNSKVIDAVMSSVQESETGSGFINAKDAVPMRTTLQEMGHPQGPTPIQFDNKCATGILTDTVVQRRSKAMDMRFYWLRDRVRQQQFHVHWKPGQSNLGDYPTKHHSTKHHIAVRPTYVLNNLRPTHSPLKSNPATLLQGCVKTHSPATVIRPLPNGFSRCPTTVIRPLHNGFYANNTVTESQRRSCQRTFRHLPFST